MPRVLPIFFGDTKPSKLLAHERATLVGESHFNSSVPSTDEDSVATHLYESCSIEACKP